MSIPLALKYFDTYIPGRVHKSEYSTRLKGLMMLGMKKKDKIKNFLKKIFGNDLQA